MSMVADGGPICQRVSAERCEIPVAVMRLDLGESVCYRLRVFVVSSLTPQEIVRWAIETYHGKLTVATAFGAEGCCRMTTIAQICDETRA
jgi:hypothetical protein